MHDENDTDVIDLMTPEERHAYNVLQTWIVFLDNLFCITFVLCITWLVHRTGNANLMWFYLLPFLAFIFV